VSIVGAALLRGVIADLLLDVEVSGETIRESILAGFNLNTTQYPKAIVDLFNTLIEIIFGLAVYFVLFNFLRFLTWIIIFPIIKIFREEQAGAEIAYSLSEENRIDVYINNNYIKSVQAKDCTIEEIGDTINELTLYEIFGENCFISASSPTLATEKLENSPKFKRVLENYNDGGVIKQHYVYIHVEESENIAGTEYYYLHENDGIWLLLCFNGENINEDMSNDLMYGRPERYVVSDLDISSLEDASAMSSLFTDATLRQLMDAGILDYNPNKLIWNMSLNELVASIT
jgi:hypothetical protein